MRKAWTFVVAMVIAPSLACAAPCPGAIAGYCKKVDNPGPPPTYTINFNGTSNGGGGATTTTVTSSGAKRGNLGKSTSPNGGAYSPTSTAKSTPKTSINGGLAVVIHVYEGEYPDRDCDSVVFSGPVSAIEDCN